MTTFLLVVFAIISVILILMVLIQNDEKNGMGGMLGGGNSAAFGSHSGSLLKKTTGVFVALFFILVFVLAFTLKNTSGYTDVTEPVLTENSSTVEGGEASSATELASESAAEAATNEQ